PGPLVGRPSAPPPAGPACGPASPDHVGHAFAPQAVMRGGPSDHALVLVVPLDYYMGAAVELGLRRIGAAACEPDSAGDRPPQAGGHKVLTRPRHGLMPLTKKLSSRAGQLDRLPRNAEMPARSAAAPRSAASRLTLGRHTRGPRKKPPKIAPPPRPPHPRHS